MPSCLRLGLDSPDLCSSSGHWWQPRLRPPLCLTCWALANTFPTPRVGIPDPHSYNIIAACSKFFSTVQFIYIDHSAGACKQWQQASMSCLAPASGLPLHQHQPVPRCVALGGQRRHLLRVCSIVWFYRSFSTL